MAGLFVYDENFFKEQAGASYKSALIVLRLFAEKIFKPKSVLDVGCGVGTWLKAWQKFGVKDIAGIDGNEIPDTNLYVPRSKIEIADLDSIHKVGSKKYDLAMSFETGEHLKDKTIDNFVKFLSLSSDLILFSAAIPNQGGFNHINEQPLSYWVKHFAKYKFECFDIMRPLFLQHSDAIEDVKWWYIQNILVFAKNDKAKALKSKGFVSTANPIMFYHSNWGKLNSMH